MKKCNWLFTILLFGSFYFGALYPLVAQHWQAPVCGSWVMNESAQQEGIVLAENSLAADIIVPATSHSAVKQAAQFLASDIEKLSGQRPQILTTARAGKTSIRLVLANEAPAFIDVSELRGKWEAYLIKTAANTVWLVGSDFRGTAFAAYTLSERLGIDPLYHWTGYTPKFHHLLRMKNVDYFVNEPVFKYRGLFHDDEDILPAPLDHNGYPQYAGGRISNVWYERFFETALRLRLNQVAPFVRVFRPFEIQQLASDWGLFYSSHHYDILLSNPFGFETFGLAKTRGVSGAYDWSENKEGLMKYWKAGVSENKDLNCIWPVGLRGTRDASYNFKEGITLQEKNKEYTTAIHNQVALAKSILPSNSKPVFHFTLYGEMLENYTSGNLDFPEDVILVWNDDGDGKMRALPKSLGKWKHGIYYHLAYYGQTTKQTHHTIRPDRIEQEFRAILKSGATEYLLLNVSELREHVMNTRFIADIAWYGEAAFRESKSSDQFVSWWAREYFGADAAKAVFSSYRTYFDILNAHNQIWEGTKQFDRALNKLEFRLKGDHHIQFDEEDQIVLNQLEQRLTKYHNALNLCAKAEVKLNPQQKQFFFENVTLGLYMDYYPTRAAKLLLLALKKYPDEPALAAANEALVVLEELEEKLSASERPPFENWYRNTWIRRTDSWTNPHYAYIKLKSYLENRKPRYK